MELFADIMLITGIAGIAGTGLGGLSGIIFKRGGKKGSGFMLGFAGGVMLSVVCFDLIPQALLLSHVMLVLSGTALGFCAVFLLNSLTCRVSAVYGNSAGRSGSLITGGAVTAVAIALHNLPEGMVIGSSFVPAGAAHAGGLAIAAVMGLHNIPEGMAVALQLTEGGMKKTAAVLLTALAGAPTVAGAAFGFMLGNINPLWLSLSLSAASGAMLYVVFGELPASVNGSASGLPAFAVLAGILTGILMTVF